MAEMNYDEEVRMKVTVEQAFHMVVEDGPIHRITAQRKDQTRLRYDVNVNASRLTVS